MSPEVQSLLILGSALAVWGAGTFLVVRFKLI